MTGRGGPGPGLRWGVLLAGVGVLAAGCGGSSTRGAGQHAASPAGQSSSAGTPSPAAAAGARGGYGGPPPDVVAGSGPSTARLSTAAVTPSPRPSPSPSGVPAVVRPRPATAPSPATRPAASPSPRPVAQVSPAPARSSAPPAGVTHTIDMTAGFAFAPASLTIAVGDRVLVRNTDSAHHTFTGPGFDSGDVGPGATYSFRFDRAGRFDFVCSYHQSAGMTGTITVR